MGKVKNIGEFYKCYVCSNVVEEKNRRRIGLLTEADYTSQNQTERSGDGN